MEKKRPVGRPKIKGLDRRTSRTCSIPVSIEKKVKKYFKNIGEAVIFAVESKEIKN